MTHDAQKSKFEGSLCGVACSCEELNGRGKVQIRVLQKFWIVLRVLLRELKCPHQKNFALENFKILSTSLETFNPSEI